MVGNGTRAILEDDYVLSRSIPYCIHIQIQRDGFMFERGPRGFRPSGNGLTTLRLIEDLGLESEAVGTSSNSKNRFLWIENKMMQLPSSTSSLLRDPKLSFMLLSGLLRDIVTSKISSETDETVYDFACRRFGVDVASLLVDSMISGIYAGNSKELSIRSCFPLLHKLENEHGSVLKGMVRRSSETSIMTCRSLVLQNFEKQSEVTKKLGKSMQVSFQYGMETLAQGLESVLRKDEEHVTMRLNSRVSKLQPQGNGVVVVTLDDDSTILADHVVSTLSADVMANITSSWSSLVRDSFEDLALKTKSVDVGVVNMAWRDNISLPYDGFGFLVPSREWTELLGVTWDSLVFPSQQDSGACVVTAMLGGAHHPHIGNMNDLELRALAERLVLPKLNIQVKPSTVYSDVAKSCIPQYRTGHHKHVLRVENALCDTHVSAIGTSLYGVGVADLIHRALLTADSLTP